MIKSRIIAILLTLIMVITSFTLSAFAEGDNYMELTEGDISSDFQDVDSVKKLPTADDFVVLMDGKRIEKLYSVRTLGSVTASIKRCSSVTGTIAKVGYTLTKKGNVFVGTVSIKFKGTGEYGDATITSDDWNFYVIHWAGNCVTYTPVIPQEDIDIAMRIGRYTTNETYRFIKNGNGWSLQQNSDGKYINIRNGRIVAEEEPVTVWKYRQGALSSKICIKKRFWFKSMTLNYTYYITVGSNGDLALSQRGAYVYLFEKHVEKEHDPVIINKCDGTKVIRCRDCGEEYEGDPIEIPDFGVVLITN